jgi:hypothetical protein
MRRFNGGHVFVFNTIDVVVIVFECRSGHNVTKVDFVLLTATDASVKMFHSKKSRMPTILLCVNFSFFFAQKNEVVHDMYLGIGKFRMAFQ